MSASAALVFAAEAGVGGLGLQAASALAGLAEAFPAVHAFGSGAAPELLPPEAAARVTMHIAPRSPSPVASRYTWLRWWMGRRQFLHDSRLGRWACTHIEKARPHCCYLFTQVAAETLRWAKRTGVPTVLDSPNGHIRAFRDVYRRESERLCGTRYLGHPTTAMVERVEEEYDLADSIRVSSDWARESLIQGGVPSAKVKVFPQPINLRRFAPAPLAAGSAGPLRVCYVGSLDLRKGFVHLLRSARAFGPERIALRFVGATGDRCCRRLLARESRGLALEVAAGDPVPAYRWAEVFVLPSLEDGFGFVVAEAMACGRPVIVADSCGAASLVGSGDNGWVVRSGDCDALTAALEEAYRRRADLPEMGRRARRDVEAFAGRSAAHEFRLCLFPEGLNVSVERPPLPDGVLA